MNFSTEYILEEKSIMSICILLVVCRAIGASKVADITPSVVDLTGRKPHW